MLDGRMNGNIDTPTVAMIPVAASEDPAKAMLSRPPRMPTSASNAPTKPIPGVPSSTDSHVIGQPGRHPARSAVMCSGLDGPSGSTARRRCDSPYRPMRRRRSQWRTTGSTRPLRRCRRCVPRHGRALLDLDRQTTRAGSTSIATDNSRAEQVKRREQPQERAVVEGAQIAIEAEGSPSTHCRPRRRTPAQAPARRRTAPSPTANARQGRAFSSDI